MSTPQDTIPTKEEFLLHAEWWLSADIPEADEQYSYAVENYLASYWPMGIRLNTGASDEATLVLLEMNYLYNT